MLQKLAARTLLATLFSLVPAMAQITGDLIVRVTDPSDAVITGAKVTVKSSTQGSSREQLTDTQGFARFTLLSIGDYDIRIEANGFSTATTKTVVNTGQVRELKTALEVSSTRQEIVIEDSAVSINTSNAQMQVSVESSAITKLSLPNGVLSLAGTTPGVIPVTPRNPFLGQGSYNSNGGRGRGNNITVDNAVSTDVSTTGGAGLGTVPLDAIKEVTVISNNFSAEFGRNASSQFQLVTKSGTNQFHGSAAHFLRNDKLFTRLDQRHRVFQHGVQRAGHFAQLVVVEEFGTGFVVAGADRVEGFQDRADLPCNSQVHAEDDRSGEHEHQQTGTKLRIHHVTQIADSAVESAAHAIHGGIHQHGIVFRSCFDQARQLCAIEDGSFRSRQHLVGYLFPKFFCS